MSTSIVSRVPVLTLLLVVMAASAPGQYSLTTTYNATSGQPGNMFDVVALNPVVIRGFDLHLDPGVWNVSVFTRPGTWPPGRRSSIRAASSGRTGRDLSSRRRAWCRRRGAD